MKKISVSLFLLLISFASCSFTSKKFENPDKDKLLLEIVQYVMKNGHFSPTEIDDDFSKKVYTSYLKHLDSQKRYFLQTDINEFKRYEIRLDDDLKKNDLSFFNLTYDRLTQRIKEAEEVTKNIFSTPINFSSSLSINTDFEKIPYVKNKTEFKKRWEEIVTFSSISTYVTKEKEEKTKKEKETQYKEKLVNELLPSSLWRRRPTKPATY